jgi:hypothetical protein
MPALGQKQTCEMQPGTFAKGQKQTLHDWRELKEPPKGAALWMHSQNCLRYCANASAA